MTIIYIYMYNLTVIVFSFIFFRVALELITQRSKNTSLCRKQSLLDEYLKNEALDIKDIVGMACDILLAGVDTVSFRARIGFWLNTSKFRSLCHTT